MAAIDTTDLISISDASKLGVSSLIRQAELGHDRVVFRNNKPVAAVISMERLGQIQELQEELLDISLVAARMLTTGEQRRSLDEVLLQFGYTREQLRELLE